MGKEQEHICANCSRLDYDRDFCWRKGEDVHIMSTCEFWTEIEYEEEEDDELWNPIINE